VIAAEMLLSLSEVSLRELELNRLAHAANLRKQITTLLSEWTNANAEAAQARWMIEHGKELLELSRIEALQESFQFVGSALVEVLPKLGAPKSVEGNAADQRGQAPVGEVPFEAKRAKLRA
jgi:hypothetical protein